MSVLTVKRHRLANPNRHHASHTLRGGINNGLTWLSDSVMHNTLTQVQNVRKTVHELTMQLNVENLVSHNGLDCTSSTLNTSAKASSNPN